MNSGVLYLLGDFTQINGATRNYLAAVDQTTGQLNSWNPSPDVSPADFAIGEGVAYIVGGYFSSLGGQIRQFIGAVDLVNGVATSWQPTLAGAAIYTVDYLGGIVYVGGSFTAINGSTRNNIGAINASDASTTTWNPDSDGEVTKILIRGDKVYIGGSFSLINGSNPKNFLARVSLAGVGSADNWTPAIVSSSASPLEDVYETSGFVYFVGNFDSVNGQTRASAAKVDFNFGNVTDSWNPGIYNNGSNFSAKSILPFSNRLFVGGNYIYVNIVDRNYLFSVDFASGSLTIFSPNFNGLINDIVFYENYIYASGNFLQAGSLTRNGFVEMDLNTAQPTTWNPSFGAGAGQVQTLAVQGNSLYIGGDFTTVNASSISRLAKIDLSQYDLNINFQTALAKIDRRGAVDRSYSQLQSGNITTFSILRGIPFVVGNFYSWNKAFTSGIWAVQ